MIQFNFTYFQLKAENSLLKTKLEKIEKLNVQLQEKMVRDNTWSAGRVDQFNLPIVVHKNTMEPKVDGVGYFFTKVRTIR